MPTGRWLGRLALLILAAGALALRVWANKSWPATFNSDEAIFGLMARHILDGERPAYFWGQNYLGGAEAYVSAPFVAWLGMSVDALRAAGLFLFACVLALQSWLVARHLGTFAAAVALALVGAPSSTLILGTANLVTSFGTMGLLGLGALGLLAARGDRWAAVRLLLAGVLLGLVLWVKVVGVVYFAGAAGVCLLRVPEWGALRRRLGWPGWVWALAIVAGAGLGVLAFFADGCANPLWRETAATAARLALAAMAVIGGVGVLAVSQRRAALFARAAVFGAGVVLGYVPALAAWLGGQPPTSGSVPACPTGIPNRLVLLVEGILPFLAGDWHGRATTLTDRLHGLALALLLAGLLALAVWQRRAALRALLAGRAGADETFVLGAVLVVALNVGLVLLAGSTLDVSAGRYLVPGWHALTMAAAAAVARLPRRVGLAAVGVVALAIGVPGVVSVAAAPSTGLWDPQWTRAVEQHLVSRGAASGFADYWTAYVLDYVSTERLKLSVYDGVLRRPAYEQSQTASPLLGYVFGPGEAPPGVDSLEPVAVALQRQAPVPGWIRPDVVDRMAHQVVVERTQFGPWDVVVASEGARVDARYLATATRPVDLTAGGMFVLVGYAVERDADGRGLVLRLFWRALRPPDFDYSAAAHLVDAGGRLVAQQDHAPGEMVGNPPHRWSVGDVIVDPHRLALPAGAPAGSYRLRVGLYDWRDGRPLPIGAPGRPPQPVAFLDDSVALGP